MISFEELTARVAGPGYENSRALVYFVVALSSCLLSLLLTPLVRNIVVRLGLLDMPTKARNVHVKAIPRVGGVAIFIAFIVPMLALYLIRSEQSWLEAVKSPQLQYLVLLSFFIFLLGLVDDIWSLRASVKFVVQIVIAGCFAFFLGQITTLNNPLMSNIIQLGWLSLPVTILWIVGVMNAFNLIDGVDGLASGSALFTTLTMMYISATTENYELVVVLCALAGALMGFLRFNFNPATIFLGDCGSLFIGFTLAALSILGTQKSTTLVAIFIPVVAFGFPILETALSILRRFISGKPIFGADRGHIHHRLLAKGFSQRQVVLILYSVSTAFALLCLFLRNSSSRTFIFVLLAAGIVVWLLVRQLGYDEFDELVSLPQKVIGQRQVITNNLRIKQELKHLATAASLDQLFTNLDNCFHILKPDYVEISIPAGAVFSEDIHRDHYSVEQQDNRLVLRWRPGHVEDVSSEGQTTLSLPFKCGAQWGSCNITLPLPQDYKHLPFDFYLLSHFMPQQLGETLSRLLTTEAVVTAKSR